MLGNKKSTVSVAGKTTLISRDTVVLGDLRFSGTVDVEGLVQGNLIAESGKEALVRVVEKGRVEGEIRCPAVIINGEVEGDVYASKHLELAARARVKGNVFYALMEMAAGSEVNGSMSHLPEQDAASQASPQAAAAGTADARGRGRQS
jgi:cytoskeletal protein CcmA (bactofilin family)